MRLASFCCENWEDSSPSLSSSPQAETPQQKHRCALSLQVSAASHCAAGQAPVPVCHAGICSLSNCTAESSRALGLIILCGQSVWQWNGWWNLMLSVQWKSSVVITAHAFLKAAEWQGLGEPGNCAASNGQRLCCMWSQPSSGLSPLRCCGHQCYCDHLRSEMNWFSFMYVKSN